MYLAAVAVAVVVVVDDLSDSIWSNNSSEITIAILFALTRESRGTSYTEGRAPQGRGRSWSPWCWTSTSTTHSNKLAMSNNHNHTHPDEEAPLLPQSQSPPPPPPPSRFSQILTHGLSTPFERTLAALGILLFLSTTLAFGLFAGEVLKGGDRGSPTRPGNPTRPGGPGQGNDKVR